jgi:hypothetical protein
VACLESKLTPQSPSLPSSATRSSSPSHQEDRAVTPCERPYVTYLQVLRWPLAVVHSCAAKPSSKGLGGNLETYLLSLTLAVFRACASDRRLGRTRRTHQKMPCRSLRR